MYYFIIFAVFVATCNLSFAENSTMEKIYFQSSLTSGEVIQIEEEAEAEDEADVDSVVSEAEEQEKIDKEISKEGEGDEAEGDEAEEAKRLADGDKYILNGIAMPDKNQIRKGDVYYLNGVDELKLENTYFDIPVVYNKRVRKWIDYYRGKGRKYFELHIERAGRYAPLIGTLLEERGLPRDLIFLAMAESGFNNHAKSIAAAVGPWQFMPATGKMYSLKQDWFVDERKDPVKATIAAATYLAKLYNDFGSWKMAMAAYNAGEGKIGKAIKKYKTNNYWEIIKGRYLKSETKNYVPKIMALAIMGKNLKSFGFNQVDFKVPLSFDEIIVSSGTDLIKISKELNIEIEQLRKLNPELKRWFTPLDLDSYTLRLPLGKGSEFQKISKIKDFKANDFQVFKITKPRMKIKAIADKFKINNPSVLSILNNVKDSKILKKGEMILLPFRNGHIVSRTNPFYADLFYKSKNKSQIRKIHIVRKGESLHRIAKKYKLSIGRLLAVNSIKKSNKISIGKKLVIR